MRIENIEGIQANGRYYVMFELVNGEPGAYELDKAYVFDQSRTINHAGFVRLRAPAFPSQGLIGIIPGDERAKVLVQVLGITDVNTPLMLMLTAPSGLRPLMAAIPQWELVPRNEEARRLSRQRGSFNADEEEEEEDEPTAEERMDAAEKDRAALHVQGTAGVIWLTDGLAQNLAAATSLTGVGVRVLYGFNRYLAVEAAAMAARTGSARFDDATYNGMSGTLERSAGLGRIEAGAKVRLGYPTIPFLRIGVGLQGASITSTFMVDGSGVAGPGVVSAFDALWYFGGGVERRFWDGFVAGLGVSAMFVARSLGTTIVNGSIEAGAYLGYSWKP